MSIVNWIGAILLVEAIAAGLAGAITGHPGYSWDQRAKAFVLASGFFWALIVGVSMVAA